MKRSERLKQTREANHLLRDLGKRDYNAKVKKDLAAKKKAATNKS